MASLSWTDSVGAATLSNVWNSVSTHAGRFANWTPDSIIVGPAKDALGTGDRHVFEFRTDYIATFELRDIPETSHALMMRLSRHLQRGGSVTVTTGDASSTVYTCKIAPGAERPVPEMTDERDRFYRMTFTLKNTAAADLVVSY